MFKSKLQLTDYLLIAINLIPVVGVWLLGWSAIEVFIVYSLETLIAGFFTVLQLGVIWLHKKNDLWNANNTPTKVSGLFFIVFFIFHYGLFTCVQTSIFAASANINPPGTSMYHFYFNWYKYITHDTALLLLVFFIGYLVKDFVPFVSRGEYKRTSMMLTMFRPYPRIFIQQFIVILGSMFLTFGWTKIFIVIFAAVKICFEIFLNLDGYIRKANYKMEAESKQQ